MRQVARLPGCLAIRLRQFITIPDCFPASIMNVPVLCMMVDLTVTVWWLSIEWLSMMMWLVLVSNTEWDGWGPPMSYKHVELPENLEGHEAGNTGQSHLQGPEASMVPNRGAGIWRLECTAFSEEAGHQQTSCSVVLEDVPPSSCQSSPHIPARNSPQLCQIKYSVDKGSFNVLFPPEYPPGWKLL